MRGRFGFALSTAVAMATLGIGGGVAQGALAGPSGELHGCVNGHHVLSVIKFTGKCPKHETSITFGAEGAPGPAGATGAPGAPGQPADGSRVTTLENEVNTLTNCL